MNAKHFILRLRTGGGLLEKLIRFGSVGIVATGVYFVSISIFVLLLNWPPEIASVVAYGVGTVLSFGGQSELTFRTRPTAGHFTRFLIVSISGLLVSYYSVRFAVEVLSISYAWGALVTCLIVPLLSFMLMNGWVFTSRSNTGG